MEKTPADIGRLHEVIRYDLVGNINELKPVVQFEDFPLHSPYQVVRGPKIRSKCEEGHAGLIFTNIQTVGDPKELRRFQ